MRKMNGGADMNKRALRFTIAAQWLLGVLAAIVGILEEGHLTEELQSHMRGQQTGKIPDTLIVVVAFLLLVLLC